MFGTEESGKVRMLGSWMGWKEDVDERLKRASRAWWKTRNRIRGVKFSRNLQARVVEACVESTLLFDCQGRSWRIGEIKRLQKMIDKAYRYVWSRKKSCERQKRMETGSQGEDGSPRGV